MLSDIIDKGSKINPVNLVNKQDLIQLVERSADTLDQRNETNKSIETYITSTEPAPVKLEHRDPDLPNDDVGKHTQEASLSHPKKS